MGILETLLTIAGIGAGLYYGTFYLLPYLQQMNYAPYYYLQAFAQQQAQAQQPVYSPPPAAAPPVESTPEPTEETPSTDTVEAEEPVTPDTVEDAVDDALEDAGLVSDAPTEEKTKKKKTGNEKEAERSKKAEEDLKKKNAAQKKKREEYDKSVDPKKDTRSAAELKKAQKAAGFYATQYRSIYDL